MSKKIFSGVQPTGNLHLGNYLGAIKNFVTLDKSESNKCIFCVLDLHAITVKQNPNELKERIGRLERILRTKTQTKITLSILKDWIKKANQIYKSV